MQVIVMGYTFVFLSVFSNSAKGYCTKKISDKMTTLNDAMKVHLLRNILCCVIAGIIFTFSYHSFIFQITPGELILFLLSGISMSVFLLSWTFAIKTDAYMLVSACASASFIVPCLIGLLFLKEHFTLFKLLSFCEIIAALFFLLRYNFNLKGRLNLRQILLLAAVLLSQGINQSVQKLYTFYYPMERASKYTFFSFLFTALALLAAQVFLSVSHKSGNSSSIVKSNLFYIIVMALSLFGASFFQTLASARIEAIILYPLANALSLIASSIMAALFFKEPIHKNCIIGLLFVLGALICSRL